jgi:thioredoxin reductase (NADPH)
MENHVRNVVIIGSGCSGHTAALYTARANLKPLIVEGHEPGGQLSLTTLVENFPGFPEGIQGPELVENMRKQAARFGADYRLGHITSVDLSVRPFRVHISHEVVYARTLIIASGASARWLGLPHEQKLIGRGVSSCATCDGFFFTDREIAVIGGGDSAMEEATFLTRFATKVTVIHRRDDFRASKIMLERAQRNDKIHFLTSTVVEDVHDVSKGEVTGLKLRNVKTGDVWELPVSAMFLGIGHIPNTKIFEGQLDMDQDGYLVTKNNVFTRVQGVYACGDVQDRRYRQAITAAGSGCMAALEAEKFLEDDGE